MSDPRVCTLFQFPEGKKELKGKEGLGCQGESDPMVTEHLEVECILGGSSRLLST